MRFQFSITIITFILFAIVTQSTSNYEGVSWNEKRKLWQSKFHFNGKTSKSYFENELDAAKRVNQLCENMKILLKNPELPEMSNQQTKQQTSRYKGVCWNKETGKWRAYLSLKRQIQKYGGCYSNEMDAAKRVNQLCQEMKIPLRNSGITGMPNEKKVKRSQYKGVHWHKENRKWFVLMCLKGGKKKYGGTFIDEMDAAKRVNQLCEEMEIPLQNPGISAIPTQQYQAKKNTSKYKGVHWHATSRKWYAHLRLPINAGKQKFGGSFDDEMDAAKRVNQLCEESGISLQNPEISSILTQQYKVKHKTSQYKGVCWNKRNKKWRAGVSIEGNKIHGGLFKNELDAAKRVNKICQEHGIPSRNPRIETYVVPNEDDKKQTTAEGADPVNSSEIPKNDDYDDGANEKKRKRKKDFIEDENFLVEDYYFYDHLLK